MNFNEHLLQLVGGIAGEHSGVIGHQVMAALEGRSLFTTNVFTVPGAKLRFVVFAAIADYLGEIPQLPLLIKTHDCAGDVCATCQEVEGAMRSFGIIPARRATTAQVAGVFQSRFGSPIGQTFIPLREGAAFTGGDLCWDSAREHDRFTWFDLSAVRYGGSVYLYIPTEGLWVFTRETDDCWNALFETRLDTRFQLLLARAMEANS